MAYKRTYTHWSDFEPKNVTFALSTDKQGKPRIQLAYNNESLASPALNGYARGVSMVTPSLVTNWPRVNGEGNFGTTYGPTDYKKTKFNLDLSDAAVAGQPLEFDNFAAKLDALDDKLLEFVLKNQTKVLGRKNLSRDEVKVLQIRSVKHKYDKQTEALLGRSVQMSASKFTSDGMGSEYENKIIICDKDGVIVPKGVVRSGDVVSALMYLNLVYCGVAGDKFGVHWGFEGVSVKLQNNHTLDESAFSVFKLQQPSFARPYDSAIDFSEASVYA